MAYTAKVPAGRNVGAKKGTGAVMKPKTKVKGTPPKVVKGKGAAVVRKTGTTRTTIPGGKKR